MEAPQKQLPGIEVRSIKQRSKNRKILFVVNEPRFFVTHRLPLALAAKNQGWDVFVAAPNEPEKSQLTAVGLHFVPIRLLKTSINPINELRLLWELTRLYRSLRPDIIHHVTIKPVLFGSFAARIARSRAVVNAISGMGYVFTSEGVTAAIRRKIITILYRLALGNFNSAIIVQNSDDLEIFRCLGPGPVIRQRGVGTDCSLSPAEEEPNSPLCVLMVARLLRSKGVSEFVEAAAKLKAQFPQVRFVLVGDRPGGNLDCISAKDLRLWEGAGNVEFVGYQNDVIPWIKNCHVACLPSYREGMPKFLVDAAALGKPIVTTNVPGCREIVRNLENGFTVPPRNSIALAAALRTLIESPTERLRMGRKSRQIVLSEGYDEKLIINDTLGLYESLNDKNPKSPAQHTRASLK